MKTENKAKPLTKDERDEAMRYWRQYIERHEATIQSLEQENEALKAEVARLTRAV